MYILIPIGLTAIFVFYILYLAFVKKNIKNKVQEVVLPSLFFIAIWGLMYFFLLK